MNIHYCITKQSTRWSNRLTKREKTMFAYKGLARKDIALACTLFFLFVFLTAFILLKLAAIIVGNMKNYHLQLWQAGN